MVHKGFFFIFIGSLHLAVTSNQTRQNFILSASLAFNLTCIQKKTEPVTNKSIPIHSKDVFLKKLSWVRGKVLNTSLRWSVGSQNISWTSVSASTSNLNSAFVKLTEIQPFFLCSAHFDVILNWFDSKGSSVIHLNYVLKGPLKSCDKTVQIHKHIEDMNKCNLSSVVGDEMIVFTLILSSAH